MLEIDKPNSSSLTSFSNRLIQGGNITSVIPICEWLWKAAFAQGREVQSVWFLVRPTRLDVQVLEYMYFALETNLKHTNVRRVCLE